MSSVLTDNRATISTLWEKCLWWTAKCVLLRELPWAVVSLRWHATPHESSSSTIWCSKCPSSPQALHASHMRPSSKNSMWRLRRILSWVSVYQEEWVDVGIPSAQTTTASSWQGFNQRDLLQNSFNLGTKSSRPMDTASLTSITELQYPSWRCSPTPSTWSSFERWPRNRAPSYFCTERSQCYI